MKSEPLWVCLMARSTRKISAKEVVADIRASASRQALMAKYNLTESQLQSLFARLVTSGLIEESELEGRKAGREASMGVSPPLFAQSRDPAVTLFDEANALVEKASSKSELELAVTKYEQASQIFLRLNEHEDACKALNQMGSVYERLEQYYKQLECYERSLAIFRKIGHHTGESAVLMGIAGVYESLGQHQQAGQFAKQSVDLFLQIQDVPEKQVNSESSPTGKTKLQP